MKKDDISNKIIDLYTCKVKYNNGGNNKIL